MRVDTFRAGAPVWVFLLLALAIAGLGYFAFQQQSRYLKEIAQKDLAAIADLKADQIARWRSERQGDAQSASNDYFLVSAVARWFQEGSPPGERSQRIRDRLTTMQRGYGYGEVDLLDDQGVLRLSASGPHAISASTQTLALEAVHTGAVLFSDLRRTDEEAGRPVRLDLFAPLIDGRGRGIGVLLLRIDPGRFLFPLIQSWPTSSTTAETLLVERAGNDVVYLNELRHRQGTALSMRRPISDKELPAAIAAQGFEGEVEGIDYRGVPVLAATRKIEDSPWFIVAKVDRQEVYEPVRERVLAITASVFGLVSIAGLSTLLWWRQQRSRFLLRESRERLERQALLQHYDFLSKFANDIILLCDSEFRIIELNDRALGAYGYTREEFLGLHIRDLRTPAAAADFDRLRQRVAEREALLYETLHQRKDKTVFPVEVSARLIGTEGKTFYQEIIRDITERKQMEEKLRQHRDHLEEMVKQRTSELENANSRLQDLDRLKSLFIASMSHELRTPLNIIVGFTGVLLQRMPGELNDEQRKQLKMVKDAGARLLALVNDVIDLSQIEAGITRLSLSEFDLGELVREVAESFATELEAKSLALALNVPDKLPVATDRRRVKQILVNLVGNAVKFTERGRIEIAVAVRGGNVALRVNDTGIGIRKEDLRKLFTAFGKLRLEAQEGSGLGLYLSQKIAHLLGGHIDAESEFGAGSTFTLFFPVNPQAEVP